MALTGAAAYNLFARFVFDNRSAMTGMARTGKQLDRLQRSAMRVRAGIGLMSKGFSSVAQVGLGAAIALGAVVKEGASFEKQMSVVQSVVSKGNKGAVKDFAALEKRALQLGRTTSFTAVQAAQGMEQLARAGFSTKEVISAVGKTLRLAEADTIELSLASDIVASSIRAFKLEASDAGKVADTLAFTSASSNTNVTALGESMRYAASIAKTSGVTFQETVAALGMLGDIGLKGSIAGTALKNALLKINKPSKKVLKIFGGRDGWLNIMQTSDGQMRNFADRFELLMKKVAKFQTPAERSAALMEIFGLRGIAAAGAMESFGLKLAKLNQDPTKTYLARLKAIETQSEGTAVKMAKMRLDNLAGQWTLFKSAVSGAAIQIYKSFGTKFTKILSKAKNLVVDLGAAIAFVNKGGTEAQVIERWGGAVADIIFGVKEGVLEALSAVKKLGKAFLWAFEALGLGSGSSRRGLIKLIAKFTALATILTPVVGAFIALKMAVGGAFSIIRGMFMFIRGSAGMVAGAVGKIAGRFSGAFGKVSGALGKAGSGVSKLMATPVYVTNWPMGGLGGLGGAGGKGKTAAEKVLGAGRKGAGGGLLGKLFGGAGWRNALTGVTRTMGAVASALPAIAALGTMALTAYGIGKTISTIGKAHTKQGQKEHRKKIMKMHRKDKENRLGALEGGVDAMHRMMGTRATKLAGEQYTPEELRKQQYWKKQRRLRRVYKAYGQMDTGVDVSKSKSTFWDIFGVGVGGGAEGIKAGLRAGTRGPRAHQAKNIMDMRAQARVATEDTGFLATSRQMSAMRSGAAGIDKEMLARLFSGMQYAKVDKLFGISLKQLGIMQAMLNKQNDAEDIIAYKDMLRMLEQLAKNPTVINIDGKEVAIATKNANNKSNDRAGKPPKPGRNSKASRNAS